MERWVDAYGYEGLYQVSNTGKVRSLTRVDNLGRIRKGKIMRQCLDGKGYKSLSMSKNGSFKMKTVHRLVAISFMGFSDLQVNHKNGIKTDNRIENLEFVTQKQNTIHAYKNNLIKTKRGQQCKNSKLTEEQVREIRLIKDLHSQQEIALKYNVSRENISRILTRKTWKHLP